MNPEIKPGIFICSLKSQWVYLIITEQKQPEKNRTVYTTINKDGMIVKLFFYGDDAIRNWFIVL